MYKAASTGPISDLSLPLSSTLSPSGLMIHYPPLRTTLMLKHPGITRDRIRQFLHRELREQLVSASHPLDARLLVEKCQDEAAARASKGWTAIEKGKVWGPAYQEGWHHVTGQIPAEWAGRTVALTYAAPEIKYERAPMVEGTVWRDNTQAGGLDYGHQYFRLSDRAKGGESVDLLVQTFAHNKETTVHGWEKPRTAEPEEFHGYSLIVIEQDLLDLYFDAEAAFSLLEGLEETDPLHGSVLRALNDCVTTFQAGGPRRASLAAKNLKEALAGLRGALHHTITPVGHAHLDTAWLWPLSVTRLKMAHTTAVQLGLIERYPEHVFCHSQASQYEWLEQDHPALLERVKKAVKKGQWEAVGSMWVEADCNLTGSEALVRQFLYGRRWFQQKLGVTTEDMWLPDVFGYSAALPQILNKFGIRYFLTQKLSWNQFNKIPHHTFLWEGIDGSKIWTHFPPADTYIASGEPKEILASVKKFKDHGRSEESILLYGFGDGGGGPTEFHIERLRRARVLPGLPDIHKRRKAVEFFRSSHKDAKDLLTWKGELYFEMHRGTYTSQAANKKSNRECEFLMRDVEWLSCFHPAYPASYPAGEIEKAWKLVLLNQFHDIIPGSSVKEVYDDSKKDYEEVAKIGGAILDGALRAIGETLDAGGMEKPVALFHNATLAGQASIPWTEEEAPTSLAVDGEVKPVQLVTEFGERKLIFETPQAALGAVAVGDLTSQRRPDNAPRLKAAARRLENDKWVVKFDGAGHITSISSLDDEPAEFIAAGRLANVFQLFEDKPLFWSAWDVDIFALESCQELLRTESFEVVEKGPVRAAVELVKRFGKSTIRQRISLGPTPGIRFDTEIDWREDEKMLKVAFPVNVHAARASYEIQFGHVERPTHRNTSWDMARFEVCAQKWFDLSEGGQGVAILNDGKYGCDVLDNVMRLTLLRAPKAPDPTCDMGIHRFTYTLLPHFDQLANSDVIAAGYSLNAPVRHSFLTPGEGVGEATIPLVTTDNRSLVVESVKKAEDSSRLMVRVYEAHATRGRGELSVAKSFRRAWLADMNEHPVQELEVDEGVVRFSYKPFEILTFLLEA